LEGLLLCLRVITLNPALVIGDNLGQEGYIVGGDLTKLLVSCQLEQQARYMTKNKST
jgi:hypothetical protein